MNRRKFITSSSLSLISGLAIGKRAFAGPLFSSAAGITLGAITYSFRSMPGSIEDILGYCEKANISALELMGDPVESYAGAPSNPIDFRSLFAGGKRRELTSDERNQMDQYRTDLASWRTSVSMKPFKEIRKKFDKAGIKIYAFKPSTFGENNSDAEIEYGMKVAKILGAKSVTVELPKSSDQSARLGKLGEKNKVYVGYHAHTQATDTLWDEALAQSPYNSLNLDCGHYIAAGGDNTTESLLRLIEAKHDRITSMHMKDRTTPANGAGNVSWGMGDTPICEILNLVKNKGYDIPCTVELEYQIPEGSDAVKEVQKCISYAKKCLT